MSIFGQRRLWLAFIFGLGTGPALALQCTFTTECFETDSCQDTEFSVSLDFPNHTFSTDFGDLDVVAISKTPSLLTVFANGEGANYMLTVAEADARFATHMTDGPMMVSYQGTCTE